MKKLFTTFILVCFVSFGFSQYYYIPFINAGTNPGGLNTDDEYPSGSGLDASWTQVLAGSQSSPAWSSVETIPFSFTFNGTAFTTFKVSSSGVLSFASNVGTAPSYTNGNLPNASIPDSSICIWGLAGTGANDKIMKKTFGTAPNRQHWIFFTSYSEGSAAANYWTYWSIVFEETTNNIYIVDQRTGNATSTLSAGIQINSTTAIAITGTPSLANNAGTNATSSDNTYYKFAYGTQPAYDILGKEITTNAALSLTQAPFTIKGKIFNAGTAAVTSFDISYRANGGTPVTSSITGTNILTFTDYTYTHPTTWTPSATGVYVFDVWTSNINSNTDEDTSNDTVTKTITVYPNMVQRLPLIEGFTSSTCGPCVAGNTNLKTIFDANPNKWTNVKYQMSWPGSGDAYFTDEGGVRRTYYGINSVPWAFEDGGTAWSGNSSGYTVASLNAAYENPAFIDITASFQVIGQTVDVYATINPLINFPSSNIKFHVAVIENKTTGNTGTNGESEFFYVMKKMIPDANGTTIGPLTANTAINFDGHHEFKGSYRLPNDAGDPINHAIEHSVEEFTDLNVVVWVQNHSTKEVLQSAWATNNVGVDAKESKNGIIELFPNPANSQAFVRYLLAENQNVNIKIYNLLGEIVYSENKGYENSGYHTAILDVNNFSEGLYILKLTVGNNIFTKKLIIN